MFNGTVLDVAVGLIFVFLMLSVACSLVNERIQSYFDRRAKMLQGAITDLLGAEEAKDLIGHPLIRALSGKSGSPPSYIPSATFAVALLESLVHKSGDTSNGPLSFARVQAAVDSRLNMDTSTKRAMQALLSSAHGDMAKARLAIEHWFDSSMERLSGVYKRHINRWLLGLGFGIALVTNADAIRLVERLEHESTLREAVIAQAKAAPTNVSTDQPNQLVTIHAQLDQLDLLFWDVDNSPTAKVDQFPRALRSFEPFDSWLIWLLLKLAGCAMTALAVSLGAPFWFDLLGRLVNLRATGEKPAKALDLLPTTPTTPAAVAVAQVAPKVEVTETTVTAPAPPKPSE